MGLVKELDLVRARMDVLAHPFYIRWTAGELTADELSRYAGEYRHAVVALAEASEQAASSAAEVAPALAAGLREHAREERQHVQLWDEFARAAAEQVRDRPLPAPAGDRAGIADAPATAPAPSPQTEACAGAWTAGQDLIEQLAILYAIEASQPPIATTKLEGLQRHYGFERGAPPLAYFEVHATRDVEHARSAAELLERLASEDDAPRLLGRAEAALTGNWALLDGVDAPAPSPALRC